MKEAYSLRPSASSLNLTCHILIARRSTLHAHWRVGQRVQAGFGDRAFALQAATEGACFDPLQRQFDHLEGVFLLYTSEPFSLLGVSMGGILAIELNKILKPEKVILVSSIKNKGERPMSSKIAKALSLYPLISGYAFKMIAYFTVTFFGLMQKDHSDLFKTMLRESDSSFMRWALIKVITWDSTETFDNVVHIHGDKDLVFPMKNFDNIIKVRGGNHFMIANRYAEVNAHIQEALG